MSKQAEYTLQEQPDPLRAQAARRRSSLYLPETCPEAADSGCAAARRTPHADVL
jgi:hypothetical protein